MPTRDEEGVCSVSRHPGQRGRAERREHQHTEGVVLSTEAGCTGGTGQTGKCIRIMQTSLLSENGVTNMQKGDSIMNHVVGD